MYYAFTNADNICQRLASCTLFIAVYNEFYPMYANFNSHVLVALSSKEFLRTPLDPISLCFARVPFRRSVSTGFHVPSLKVCLQLFLLHSASRISPQTSTFIQHRWSRGSSSTHFGLVNRLFNHRFLTPLTPKFLSTIVFHERKPPFKSSSTSSRFRGRHFRCHKGSECAIKSLHLLHVRIARPSVVTSNEANISSVISAGKTRTKSVMTSSLKSIARLATRLNLR